MTPGSGADHKKNTVYGSDRSRVRGTTTPGFLSMQPEDLIIRV